ncbi:MAG: oligosaccharide flippase family protein [Bacillota bacterium]
MKKRPNLINFFYLVGSGLIIQLSGSIYRIWLARKIGPESLGIMQMVYPVYRLLSGMATLGLPLALTKWVSEYLGAKEYVEIISLRKWAAQIVSISAIIAASFLIISTPFLSQFIFTDSRVREALLVITLAIPFSALSAIYRGYFQGFSNTAPTAVSEITEQFSEIGVTFILVCVTAPLLSFSAYTYPLVGLTFGEVVCLITLIFFLNRQTVSETNKRAAVPKPEIFSYSWPLLFNQIVTAVSLASEGVIIPFMLIRAGYSTQISTGLFGQLAGMAEPVAYFPLILMSPLASVLSPQISATFRSGSLYKIRRKISRFYLISAIICLVGYLTIFLSAAPLARFLYGESVAVPIRLIKILVLGLPFTGISILNITMLAAVGATDKILYLSLWVAGLKAFLIYILTPLFGIYGSAWAINIIQIFMGMASLKELWPFLPQSGRGFLPKWLLPYRYRVEHH